MALFKVVCSIVLHATGVLGTFENWTLVYLDEAAKEKGAVCLDGSPSAYYWEVGTGIGKDKWMVHFQGGGWCQSPMDCANRAQGSLGSSTGYADDKQGILGGFDGGAHGLFSSDPAINPDFYNWNKVYSRYCDGGSRAGDAANPVVVQTPQKNETIYFRGARILDALVDDLLSKGLSSASDFLVEGCSAGGLAIWLNLDYIASLVPSSVRVKGVPQCGFFMDVPDYQGKPSATTWASAMSHSIYDTMNVSASKTISRKCKAAHSEEPWRCFIAQYALPFVETPFFAVNSFYDAWQWGSVLHMPPNCTQQGNFSSCSAAEKATLHGFRDAMLGNLSTAPSSGNYFTYSCVNHCGYLNHDKWDKLVSQGVSLRSALSQWYFNDSSFRIAAADEDPNANPTCHTATEEWFGASLVQESGAFFV